MKFFNGNFFSKYDNLIYKRREDKISKYLTKSIYGFLIIQILVQIAFVIFFAKIHRTV